MITGADSTLKTKIVCTIGPASSDRATLRGLCEAGMSMARINMSHTHADEARKIARDVRQCAVETGRPVALLVDLQGPKIRIGRLSAPVELSAGDTVTFAPERGASTGELPTTYSALADDVSAGDPILINDGRVELNVTRVSRGRVMAEVAVGGTVSSGKGINLPGVRVSAPALTEKDIADIELALEIDADYVALSFARSADHVRELRQRLRDDVLIMTKIEKDSAIEDLDAILQASDSCVVARGDLGTELPFEKVPLAQKRIVRAANALFCPVAVATEMLESMIERPRPTRAEVSDAANAILDGTDAVMLSAETAVGAHPVAVVQALTRVVREVESTSTLLTGAPPYDVPSLSVDTRAASTEVAVACATIEAVRATRAPAVVTFSKSGHTARVVSSRRPPVQVLTVTDNEKVYNQLALIWGVVPVVHRSESSYESMWETARAELLRRGLAVEGDRVPVTAGMPFDVRGTTNMVRIETV
jgi:pyruvate kinase